MRLINWIKALFSGKKADTFVYPKSPLEKASLREITENFDISGESRSITLKQMTYLDSITREAHVNELRNVMAEKKFDEMTVLKSIGVLRIQMTIFLSCYSEGKRLFSDESEVEKTLSAVEQLKIFDAYSKAFTLTEEERGNWWRERTKASPA